jgi:hypothetical protein
LVTAEIPAALASLPGLTDDEKDLFLERAGVYEFDGGLSHDEAERLAIKSVIECRKKASRSAIEAPQGLQNGFQVNLYPQAPETPPKQRYSGFEAIAYMASFGIKMIGVHNYIDKSGKKCRATINNKKKEGDYEAAFTNDIAEIKALMAGLGDAAGRYAGRNIDAFYFLPINYDLICFDIDRGHADGVDGIAEFYKLCEKLGKPKSLLPAALRNLPDSFPCYVQTPSGGLHLYFKYRGPVITSGKNLAPGIEIKHTTPGLTVPGSYKDGKSYILHGNLENAPRLYPFIEDVLPQPRKKPQQKPAPAPTRYIPDKKEFKTTLENIKQWTEQDGPFNGRNRFCYEFAKRAARDKYRFTRAEVIVFLKSDSYTAGHEQIEDAVNSAFREMGK